MYKIYRICTHNRIGLFCVGSLTCSRDGITITTLLYIYRRLTEKRRRLLSQYRDYWKKKEEELRQRRKAFEDSETD